MWLKHEDGYDKTITYEKITEKFDAEDAESLALRLLIHYVGDSHQPLHCMNRVDDEFPKGDAGGNDFPLKYHYDVDELHALWDVVIYTNHVNYKLVRFSLQFHLYYIAFLR